MVPQTGILHRIMMSTLIMGDVEASTSIHIKETIQEIDAHHMFDTSQECSFGQGMFVYACLFE